MEDVETQTPHGDTETKAARDCRILWTSVITSVVLTACIFFPLVFFLDDTHYYVAIDSASHLTRAEGLSFNLTIGVASRSYGSEVCIEPGMLHLDVYYHGVQLAASEGEVGRLCARPRKSAEQRVVTRSTAVAMGWMVDMLAEDMNQGAVAVFDIRLNLPPGSDGVHSLLVCKGSQVGAAAVWCHVPSQEPIN